MATRLKYVLTILMLVYISKTSNAQEGITTGWTKQKINNIVYDVEVRKTFDHEEDILVYGNGFYLNKKDLFGYITRSTKDGKIYSKGELKIVGRLIIAIEKFYTQKDYDLEMRFFCQEKDGNITFQELKRFLKGKEVFQQKPE